MTPSCLSTHHAVSSILSAAARYRRCAPVPLCALLFLLSACAGEDFTTKEPDDPAPSSGGSGGDVLDCENGAITFEVDTNLPDRNCFPSEGCGASWITIRDTGGKVYGQDGSCNVDCTDCATTACPELACNQERYSGPFAFTFRGGYFQNSSCNSSSCIEPRCAPEGDYVAEICFERAVPPSDGDANQCVPAGQLECTEVAFTWPDESLVALTIGDNF